MWHKGTVFCNLYTLTWQITLCLPMISHLLSPALMTAEITNNPLSHGRLDCYAPIQWVCMGHLRNMHWLLAAKHSMQDMTLILYSHMKTIALSSTTNHRIYSCIISAGRESIPDMHAGPWVKIKVGIMVKPHSPQQYIAHQVSHMF